MLTDADVDRYLHRIGADRPTRPDLAALRHLQERHVQTVPFENLDYHLEGTSIPLDEGILEKVVDRARGGGCYELNPAFAYLLEALGFDVEIHPGQVFLAAGLTPVLCHLALHVRVEGESHLVDVGFGKNSRYPLPLSSDAVHDDPHGRYQVLPVETGGHDVLLNGTPQYRLDDRAARLIDFAPTLWWYRTAPDSPFLHNVFCLLHVGDERITLQNGRLTRTGPSGRTSEAVEDADELLATYRDVFGVVLDRLPGTPAIDPTEAIVMQID